MRHPDRGAFECCTKERCLTLCLPLILVSHGRGVINKTVVTIECNCRAVL